MCKDAAYARKEFLNILANLFKVNRDLTFITKKFEAFFFL